MPIKSERNGEKNLKDIKTSDGFFQDNVSMKE